MSYPQTTSTDSQTPDTSSTTNLRVLDNKELVQWANDQYKKIKASRSSIERQWYINLAFYFGKQNVNVVSTSAAPTGFKLHVPKAPPWRVRLVINKIRPAIRKELAKTVAQKPRFTVVPASTEDEDQASARVGEAIFNAVYSDKRLKTIIRRAMWWTCITGTGFVKDYWDNGAKDVLGQKGDFCIEPVTPFHLFVPDFNEIELENQPFVIHATTKSVEWVKHRFPNIENVVANVSTATDLLDDSFMGMIGAKSPDNDSVLCLEVWIKPGGHKAFPDGGMFTVVSDTIVQMRDKYPYAHGEFPFTKLEHIESGKFYGTSIIEDMIPVQKEYNRTRSQIIEAKNKMSKPQLMAPRGSVEVQKITSEPGQVILYTPGFNPPTPLPLQNLPSYVLQEIQQLQQDLDDISGQHEISRGSNPSQVTAATALSYLQEQDDTSLSGTIESVESGVEKIGRHVLSHASQFWSEERTVRVIGKDGAFDAHVYKASDLGGNHDVRVEAGSALPTSKAARLALVMDLIKLGAIKIEDALQAIDLGGMESINEDFLVDLRQAQRENLKLSMGEGVPANVWDNHDVHIQIHDKFRKSQQFETLDEQAQALFQQHVELHQSALQAQQPPMGPDPSMGQDNANTGMPPDATGMLSPDVAPPEGQPPLPEGMMQ